MARCSDCQVDAIPPPVEILRTSFGDRWGSLIAKMTIPAMQADAVMWLWRHGHCGRHASIGGWLVGMVLDAEVERLAVLPGSVEVRHVALEREPFERIENSAARREGRPLVQRVRDFVAGSALSAIVELDLGHRRARVTLQMAMGDRQHDTVIETPRLVHLTAQELVAAIRDRAGDQAR